jgi:hypothetical protein
MVEKITRELEDLVDKKYDFSALKTKNLIRDALAKHPKLTPKEV